MPVDLVRTPHFHEVTEIHDGDPVADMLHHRQIVGNEQIGKPHLLLQIQQQVEYLALNGNIQRRDRFIADDQFRLQGDGPGDADALPLAAGKLERKTIRCCCRQPDMLQQLHDPLPSPVRLANAVNLEGLADGAAHGMTAVQTLRGILKDHLHIPADGFHGAPGKMCQVPAIEQNAAVCRGKQANHRLAKRGLAAAGLAHQSQRLSVADREGHPVHCLVLRGGTLQHASLHRKMHLEILKLEQRPAHSAASSFRQW